MHQSFYETDQFVIIVFFAVILGLMVIQRLVEWINTGN
jgi:hypothetical protein